MKNNETFGMSCEKAICEIFNDKNGIDKIKEERIDRNIIIKITPILKQFFDNNKINKLVYTGYQDNKVDFKDPENKTYSIKSNKTKSNKVSPQNVGQPTKKKFIELVYLPLKSDNDPENLKTNTEIKNWILNNIKKLLILYFDNLFCCEYLVHIKEEKNDYRVEYSKNKISKTDFEKVINEKEILFTRNIKNWNESNTVKVKLSNDQPAENEVIKTISIGEFQFHRKRDCIKFRFDYNNLMKLINETINTNKSTNDNNKKEISSEDNKSDKNFDTVKIEKNVSKSSIIQMIIDKTIKENNKKNKKCSTIQKILDKTIETNHSIKN